MDKPRSQALRRAGVRVTERDRRVLEFIAEHRLVLPGHVQALLGISRPAATRRLRALVAGGLLSTETVFHRRPPCFQITRRGLGLIGSPLPAPKLDYRSYAHDVGVAWLWLAARHGAFGPLAEVFSEREMRSRDGSERHQVRRAGRGARQDRFGVPLSRVRRGGDLELHYPDLLLVDRDGRWIAVELELTSKSRARREKIIGGYAADARIDVVLYLVEDRRVARGIQEAARRFGFERRVHVQPVRFGEGQVPGAGRAAERERPLPAPAHRSRGRPAAAPELAR
jgi:DNA-binding MarR family transcriptional regulator